MVKKKKSEELDDSVQSSDTPDTLAVTEDQIDTIDAAETIAADAEDTLPETEASGEATDDVLSDHDETLAEPVDDVQIAQEPQVIVQKKGGTGAMILGGVIAAALGFGAAIYLEQGSAIFPQSKANEAFRAEAGEKLASLEGSVSNIEAQVKMNSDKVGSLTSELSQGPDLKAMEASLATLTGSVATLDEKLADLDARFSNLTQDTVSAALSQDVVDAYQKELADLQASLKSQREQVEAMVATAQAKEAEVAEISQNTLTRAALTRVDTALQSGRPFAAALSEYEAVIGEAAPVELSQFAQDGLTPVSELTETYVEHARAALAAARASEGSWGAGSGIANFLKTQLQARSVTPKDGDDADAVLSRAEAALKDGRLSDTLAELDTLPEASKAEMSPWMEAAKARQDALNTIETLLSATN